MYIYIYVYIYICMYMYVLNYIFPYQQNVKGRQDTPCPSKIAVQVTGLCFGTGGYRLRILWGRHGSVSRRKRAE